MAQPPDIIVAEVVETLTLVELSNACDVPADWIGELVAHGLLEPRGTSHRDWAFEGSSVALVSRAHRLRHDLGLNLEGIALALSLLDEAEQLRRRIEQLEAALAERG